MDKEQIDKDTKREDTQISTSFPTISASSTSLNTNSSQQHEKTTLTYSIGLTDTNVLYLTNSNLSVYSEPDIVLPTAETETTDYELKHSRDEKIVDHILKANSEQLTPQKHYEVQINLRQASSAPVLKSKKGTADPVCGKKLKKTNSGINLQTTVFGSSETLDLEANNDLSDEPTAEELNAILNAAEGEGDGDIEMTPTGSVRSIGSLVCRICHNSENPERLVSPCLCKGSLTYVHIHCLERWISTSRSTHCELCQFQYRTEQTLRYTCFESLRLWYSRSMSRRALQEDCQMFSLLTLVAFGIIGTLLVGIQYYFLQGKTMGLSKLWTKGWLIFFLITTLVVYFINIYVIVRSQLSPWYRWWQSTRDIKLILENKKPFNPKRQTQDNQQSTTRTATTAAQTSQSAPLTEQQNHPQQTPAPQAAAAATTAQQIQPTSAALHTISDISIILPDISPDIILTDKLSLAAAHCAIATDISANSLTAATSLSKTPKEFVYDIETHF